jgi:hypothetical protein
MDGQSWPSLAAGLPLVKAVAARAEPATGFARHYR